MGHDKKIRQTAKKTSTFKKEDFVQRSTKSGSSSKGGSKKTGGKTPVAKIHLTPAKVLRQQKKK